jgi:hypothetical protein
MKKEILYRLLLMEFYFNCAIGWFFVNGRNQSAHSEDMKCQLEKIKLLKEARKK